MELRSSASRRSPWQLPPPTLSPATHRTPIIPLHSEVDRDPVRWTPRGRPAEPRRRLSRRSASPSAVSSAKPAKDSGAGTGSPTTPEGRQPRRENQRSGFEDRHQRRWRHFRLDLAPLTLVSVTWCWTKWPPLRCFSRGRYTIRTPRRLQHQVRFRNYNTVNNGSIYHVNHHCCRSCRRNIHLRHHHPEWELSGVGRVQNLVFLTTLTVKSSLPTPRGSLQTPSAVLGHVI